jgi:hypothetical protein
MDFEFRREIIGLDILGVSGFLGYFTFCSRIPSSAQFLNTSRGVPSFSPVTHFGYFWFSIFTISQKLERGCSDQSFLFEISFPILESK